MKEKKNTFLIFVGILFFFVMCLANITPAFADGSVDENSNKNVATIESFDSAYEYTKSLFEEHSDAFYRMKEWILSEDCQAYYRIGPYPEEVRKSLYWAETRNMWNERAELYQSEPIYDDFDMLFTTYRICDIVAANDGTDGNLYGNPPTWVSFWILSEQYENEDESTPPPIGYQEKSVRINYTGTDTYEKVVSENAYIEALGNGWHLIMNGYNESIAQIQGDVSGDGTFGVSDVILLQKWLLAVPDTHLTNWKAADFNKDDILNVFDLCLMKRTLVVQ